MDLSPSASNCSFFVIAPISRKDICVSLAISRASPCKVELRTVLFLAYSYIIVKPSFTFNALQQPIYALAIRRSLWPHKIPANFYAKRTKQTPTSFGALVYRYYSALHDPYPRYYICMIDVLA